MVRASALLVAAAAVAAAAASGGRGAAALGCMDAAGASSDWWAGLKHNDGTTFSVYDGQGSFSGSEDMSSSESHAAQSLSGVYAGGSDLNYIMYNDETPSGHKSSTHGHTKGVLAFDASDKTGFWLVHSIPRWPPVQADGYSVPTNTQKYGQSFLCLSLDASGIDDVAQLFMLTWPQIYDQALTDDGKALAPNFAAVAGGKHTLPAQGTHQTITTVGGTQFVQFAKNARWGKAIGEYLVSVFYNCGFSWETWRNGTGDLLAWCANKLGCAYDSFFSTSISLPDGSSWDVSQDHSKWGVSTKSSGTSITCIGDINRQSGQYKRGGGYVCHYDQAMWSAFNGIQATVNSTCTPCDS